MEGASHAVKIVQSRYLDLPAALRARLDAAAHAEFEQYDIVRETEWSSPDVTFMALQGEEVVAYYNLVDRVVRIDGVAVRVAGLNNMVTMPAHRGRGLASGLLRETQPRWFDELSADCGLLLCADALLPFYSRNGWHKLPGPVVYAQPDGLRTWSANCMVLDPSGRLADAKCLNLCGLPW
jgi:GNAT superfamily N-acetyltransferase